MQARQPAKKKTNRSSRSCTCKLVISTKKTRLGRTNFSLPWYILLIRASLAGKHSQKAHQSAVLTLPLSEGPADATLQINPLWHKEEVLSLNQGIKGWRAAQTQGITHSGWGRCPALLPFTLQTHILSHINEILRHLIPWDSSLNQELHQCWLNLKILKISVKQSLLSLLLLPCFHSTTA